MAERFAGVHVLKASIARDDTFDFVKGVLVLLMVAYHVMSITALAGEEHFRYIRFISGSFIFVSGYLVARFVGPGFRRDPRAVTVRLMIRGGKILLIFAVLNLLIHAAGFGNVEKVQLGVAGFLREVPEIFLRGDGHISSFLILLPIGYLLVLAPIVIGFDSAAGVVATLAMLSAAIGLAAIPSVSDGLPILEFLLVGVIGLLAGLARSRYPSRVPLQGSGLVASGCGLLGAVWLSGHAGATVATYSISIAIVLLFLYEVSAMLVGRGFVSRAVVVLGRYSLLAYILQIIAIQVAFRGMGGQRTEVGIRTLAMCGCIAILLVATCFLLERTRHTSTIVDRCYRAVFS